MRLILAGLLGVGLLLTTACTNPTLRVLDKPGDGPDEFLVVPGKPLEAPQDYNLLPAPTPNGSNLTDQDPLQDSTAALGGRRSSEASGIPGADGAIVTHSSRFGVEPAIRETLAEADEAYRKRRGRFTQIRISKVDRYRDVYRPMTLKPRTELNRWRRAGARTPSAPPPQ